MIRGHVEAITSRGGRYWRLVVTLLLLSTTALLVRRKSEPTKDITLDIDSGDPEGSTFQLVSIYRHGVGEIHDWHQKLEITDQFVKSAGDYYKNQVAANDIDETIWTSNTRYATDNPFKFKFKLRSQKVCMRR